MEAVLSLILTYAVPQLGTSGAAVATQIISSLVALYPMIKQEYADLKPIVANIITALRSDPSTTGAQLDVLDKFEATLDSDYDEAYALALAEDAAALAKAP